MWRPGMPSSARTSCVALPPMTPATSRTPSRRQISAICSATFTWEFSLCSSSYCALVFQRCVRALIEPDDVAVDMVIRRSQFLASPAHLARLISEPRYDTLHGNALAARIFQADHVLARTDLSVSHHVFDVIDSAAVNIGLFERRQCLALRKPFA